MINRPSNCSPREVFLEQLNDFYATCGRPHYKEIAEISERLDDLYPLEGDRKRDLPTLSPSGISEVLAGRRKNLPSAGWLAAFVLSCQRRATELGAFGADPGVSTLPDWQRKLIEAQPKTSSGGGTNRQVPRPSGPAGPAGPAGSGGPAGPAARPPRPRTRDRGGDRPSGRTGDRPGGQRQDQRPDQRTDRSSEPPPEPPESPPESPPGPPPGPSARLPSGRGGGTGGFGGTGNAVRAAAVVGGWAGAVPAPTAVGNADVARSAVPVRLQIALREYVAGYGAYGGVLLADAQAGVIDAVYRVAVLLLGAEIRLEELRRCGRVPPASHAPAPARIAPALDTAHVVDAPRDAAASGG